MEKKQEHLADRPSLNAFVAGARQFRQQRQPKHSRWLERLHLRLDQGMAAVLLLLFSPVFLVVALLIWRKDGAPILFGHYRIGQHGKLFRCLKFRSMYLDSDAMLRDLLEKDANARAEWERDHKLLNDPRITPIGDFLRRTSLDELPQFFNVLQGRMSIVGPRPHAVAHNETYRKLVKGYMVRHKVKPGITGWAQVSGYRGETDTIDKMEKRIEYDLEYLRNWSLGFDLWIIVKTVLVVLNDKKAY